MAIEKNNFKVSRLDSEVSPGSRKSVSSDDDVLQQRSSAAESDDDDEFDDADSGAGSDDFDLLELGETGVEYCQVGNQTCGIPFELYDLLSLEEILSVDVWNECLSEEEQFGLTKYLPDVDQETFMITLTELFTGCNFLFGSPVTKLFDMLKGGLCEPRVALYREGLNFFQQRRHYNLLRKHQNTMVRNLCQIRDAWLNCRGYSIEERLRVLNIMRIQKSLMSEKMEDMPSDSSERDSGEGLRSNKIKDRKAAQQMSRHSPYGVGPNMEFAPKGRSSLEAAKHGKQNSKGILKLGGSKTPSEKEPVSYPGPYSSAAVLPRSTKPGAYDSVAALRMRDQMISSDDAEETTYGIDVQQDRFASRGGMLDKSGLMKVGKNLIRGDEVFAESLMGVPLSSKNDVHAYGRNRDANLLTEAKVFTTKPPNMRAPYDFGINAKYPGNIQQYAVGDQMKLLIGRLPQAPFRGDRYDSSDRADLFWNNRSEGEAFAAEPPFRADDWSLRSKKKWKTGRESPDLNFMSYRASPPQVNDRLLPSEFRGKPLQGKIRGNTVHNGGSDMMSLKGNRMFVKNEETESNSSDQFEDDEDSNPLLRSKLAYPTGVMEASPSSLSMPSLDAKRAKYAQKEMKNMQALEGINYSSKKMGDFVDQGNMRCLDNYSSKGKQKGKMGDSSPLQVEGRYIPGLDKPDDNDDDDLTPLYKLGKNAKFQEGAGERLNIFSLKTHPASEKKKREAVHDHYVSQSHYFVDEEDDSLQMRVPGDGSAQGRSRNKGQNAEAYLRDQPESIEVPLLGCSLVTKKRKGKEDAMDMTRGDEDIHSNHLQRSAESNSLKKKVKRKMETDTGSSDMEMSEPPVTEMGATDTELEIKPQKKPFILITPTVHTGFSFSIMHLLSAVRLAMITPLPEDTLNVGEPVDEKSISQEGDANGVTATKVDANNSEHAGEGSTLSVTMSTLSVTIQEIVNRIRSNPGDPCILETQEPLQDLVRGVLKIFSSKTAPLAAKGWKPLAAYEKATKSWSWTGPVSHSSSDNETIEEVTSPEAWGLPHKMLVKLVDSFANWLKCGQETLQQIGSLPAPPLELMQPNVDEKERFRDLRAQKSLSTINPSSEEVKAYFRKVELLRYSVPDRAFTYTAADGKKSIVAPLRRCGGKPTSKARDHFMLKRDRPPHVTILCLVRDAAARLPGSIGTRADVCTLIRDSQYIVEDVSDTQVNQVVSGALDRLHYERDPCVQFDGERKLWVYLHREREEEDFEDDGTSSTKKWKRQKKDAADQPDLGGVTVAYHGSEEQTGYDLCSDLNADPSFFEDDKGMELEYDDARQDADVDVDVDANQGSEQDEMRQDNLVWEGLDLNPMRESKLLCQENSTNEDFGDETFGRERTIGLLSASLL